MTDIYDKHDPKFTKKITINKFITIMKEIFKECQMSMTEIIKPSDIFKVDYIEHLNPEAANKIIEKLFLFMFNDRDTYNQLIKEKKHIIDKSDEEVLFTVEKRLIAEKISENNAECELCSLFYDKKCLDECKILPYYICYICQSELYF